MSEFAVAIDVTENNPDYSPSTPSTLENSPLIDQLSQPLVGKWNVLVSQTNWEKGSLILTWRNELIAAGMPNSVYSDESWARMVGNVTAQHVGRLRRVSERFGETYKGFSGLYWSHFFAALEWEDAELWLEGAVQNKWSVAQMRVQRWEAVGGTSEQKPSDDDVFIAEIDEDSFAQRTPQDSSLPNQIEGHRAAIGAAGQNDADGGSIDDVIEGFDATSVGGTNSPVTPSKKSKNDKASAITLSESNGAIPSVGELMLSLKEISQFPEDLAEPLELLKVAILNHKLAGWASISAAQLCQTLESLIMLTAAVDAP